MTVDGGRVSRRTVLTAVPAGVAATAGCAGGETERTTTETIAEVAAKTATPDPAESRDSDGDGVVDADDEYPEQSRFALGDTGPFAEFKTSGVADFDGPIEYAFRVESPYDEMWSCSVRVVFTVYGGGRDDSLFEDSIGGIFDAIDVPRDQPFTGADSVTLEELTDDETFGFIDRVKARATIRASPDTDSAEEIGDGVHEDLELETTLPYE